MENGFLVNKIREQCKQRDVSVSQMELDLGFSLGLISRWAKTSPSIDKIVEVANYLEISLDELTGRGKKKEADRLVRELCEATRVGELLWLPYGKKEPFAYPIECLEELQQTEWRCFYSRYGAGFFIILREVTEELEICRLYILADPYGIPISCKADEEELSVLWKLADSGRPPEAEMEKAQDLIEQFIRERGMEYSGRDGGKGE